MYRVEYSKKEEEYVKRTFSVSRTKEEINRVDVSRTRFGLSSGNILILVVLIGLIIAYIFVVYLFNFVYDFASSLENRSLKATLFWSHLFEFFLILLILLIGYGLFVLYNKLVSLFELRKMDNDRKLLLMALHHSQSISSALPNPDHYGVNSNPGNRISNVFPHSNDIKINKKKEI